MPRRAQPHPTNELARRLFFTRLALGYTDQGEYARNAGMTPQTYNPYETGARKQLSRFVSDRLIARYKVTREWLYDGIPDRLPHALVMKLIAYGAIGGPSACGPLPTPPPRK